MGTRGLREGEQELYDTVTNVDGTRSQQSTPQTPVIPRSGQNTSSGESNEDWSSYWC